MNFGELLCMSVLALGGYHWARWMMFNDELARSFSLWWTETAPREAAARIFGCLATTYVMLLVLGLAGTDVREWQPSVALLTFQALCICFWLATGRFARSWREWNEKATFSRSKSL